MPVRDVKKRKHRKIPIGDMRDRVEVQTRQTRPGGLGGSTTVRLTTVATLWAKIETLAAGDVRFNGVAVEDRPTDIFVCRRPVSIDVTSEHQLLFSEDRFDILSVEPLERRGGYIRMTAKLLGGQDQAAASS